MNTESSPTVSSGFIRTSSSIDNVKYILIYLKNSNPPNNIKAEDNPYIFKAINNLGGGSYLTNCRLEYGNSGFYPETEYDTDFKMQMLISQ